MVLKTLGEYRNIRMRMYSGRYSGTKYWLDSLIITCIEEVVSSESRFLWSMDFEEIQTEYEKDVRKQKRIERQAA